MKRVIPSLSQGMLIAGVLLILAGLGWGIRTHLNAPPPPTIMSEGAVVLAVTAPLPTSAPTAARIAPANSAIASPTPTTGPALGWKSPAMGPTPELLPDWTSRQASDATLATATMRGSPTPTPVTSSNQSSSKPSPVTPGTEVTPAPIPTHPPESAEPPTRIVAPAINLDAKVVPMGWDLVTRDKTMVSEWIVPSGAAGWHVNSALPGHNENTVLSGHHNIEGKVFRHIVDLELGDAITLYASSVPYVYNVTEKYILKESGMPLRVRQRNAQWILPTGDERLTLVTCWPYEWPGNSHRVIVVARPADWYLERVGAIQ